MLKIRLERTLKADRIKYWISVGAQPSDTMHNMLISEGITTGKKINVLPTLVPPAPVVEAPAAVEAPVATPVEEAPVAEDAPAVEETLAAEETPAVEEVAAATE
jgi:small subunit ribosomal protein S16